MVKYFSNLEEFCSFHLLLSPCRAKSYTRALEFAETALEMAMNLNFNTEIGPAQARLHAIKAKLPDMPKINDTCTLLDLKLGSNTSESLVTSPAEQD